MVTNRFENRNFMQPIREGLRELSFFFSFVFWWGGGEGRILK
jgi:hypothetical protein